MYQDASLKKSRILSYFLLCSRSGQSAKQRSESALTHMFCVLDWHDVSRCIIKKSRILSYFWLCSRSGRSAKRRSKSALTHMFCVLDWHDVSRLIASLKNLKNLMLLLIEFTQRSIPKAEKQKQSHLYVLCSRNVNRQCQMRTHNMRVRALRFSALLIDRCVNWSESFIGFLELVCEIDVTWVRLIVWYT